MPEAILFMAECSLCYIFIVFAILKRWETENILEPQRPGP
jgi:hypothetical protein